MFFHVDLDAFFASVEILDNPSLKGKCVIVGGLPGERRSVVSTCSYEAREKGVHSAMPIAQAVHLCPDGVFLRGNMARYQQKSKEVMDILHNWLPDVTQISIDEAFLDMNGTEKLFGESFEVAKKLKKEILEKTGLTVSVGIASTMYLAKIASGINKPDGIFFIPKGSEQDFMLNLPLKKVWGIGQKTLEKINRNGFFTTKELSVASNDLLISLFGKSTGQFLFDAVHANFERDFSREAKSSSISEERTFEFDISDLNAIDKILLEMSSNCMFRLLNMEKNSKTVFIKIRYEDFSTVTIQKTFEQTVKSIESLHEKAFSLFKQKYTDGKGIRLLGLGFQNISDGLNDSQKELFDDDDEKRQKLEQVISEIKKKNPTLTIKKARLLSTLLIIGSLIFFPLTSANSQESPQISAQNQNEKNENAINKDSVALFDYKMGNANVELFAQGYWKMLFATNLNLNFYKDGTKSTSYNPFLFSQEIDLTLWFMLNNTWYFEGSFSDGFNKNYIALGYQSSGIVKQVRAGNSKISFPDFYQTNAIGSSGTKSPGIMAEFSGENWQANAIFRYDNVESKSKTFSGTSEIEDNEISISDWEKGRRFYIPPKIASAINSIYVESENGSYTDTQGRTYKKLSTSQYSINGVTGELELNKAYTKSVLVSFNSSESTVQSESVNLVEKLDSIFGSSSTKSVESIFSYIGCDKNCTQLFTQISDSEKPTLILQEENRFSPFWDASFYKLKSTNSQEVYLKSSTSDVFSSQFGSHIIESETDYIENENAINSANYNFAQIYENSTEEGSVQFPLAKILPEIYLNKSDYASTQSQRETDFVLIEKSVSKNTNYFISLDAIEGTVKIFRNSIEDKSAKFNSETGCIEFINAPSQSEKIYVTWQESSSQNSLGILTGALGFKYEFNDTMDFATSISSQWNAPWQLSYADSTSSFPGFIKSTNAFNWETDNFKLSDTLTFSVDVVNSSGLYRILGFDENALTSVTLSTTHFSTLKQDFLPVLNSKTSTEFPSLLSENQFSQSTISSEYDSERKCNTTKIFWDSEDAQENSTGQVWFSWNIDLTSAGSLLQNCDKIDFYLRQDSFSSVSSQDEYEVYLQLGIDTDEDKYENAKLVPTWKISKQSESDSDEENVEESFVLESSKIGQWQKVCVRLSDVDKARLVSSYDARIIVVQKISDFTQNVQASFSCAQLYIPQRDFASDSSLETYAYSAISELSDEKASIFNADSTNYEENLVVKKNATEEFENVTFYKYFSAIDERNYKNINFFFKIPQESDLCDLVFSFKKPTSQNLSTDAISFTLPYSVLKNLTHDYHKVSVEFESGKVFIDEKETDISAKINLTDTICLFTVEFCESSQNEFSDSQDIKCQLILDEFYLSNTNVNFSLENDFYTSYEKTGIFLGNADLPIFSDAKISGQSQAQLSSIDNSNYITSDVSSSISIFGVNFALSAAKDFSQDTEKNYFDASHSIKSTELFKPFKYVKFGEEYYFSTESEQSEKTDYLAFYIPINKSKIDIGAKSKSTKDSVYTTQNYSGNVSFSVPMKGVTWNSDVKYESYQYKNDSFANQNYFNEWYSESQNQFTMGFSDAIKRNQNFTVLQEISIPYIQLKPCFKYSAKNNYKNTSEIKNKTSNEYCVQLPFSVANQDFSFSFAYKENATLDSTESQNYWGDIVVFFTQDAQSQSYFSQNQIYKFQYKRKSFYNWLDILVPQNFAFEARYIQTFASQILSQDYTDYEFTLNSNAINLFGKTGMNKIFNWYEQDEFFASLNFGFVFSQIEMNVSQWDFSGLARQSIYFTSKNYLTLLSEFQYESDDYWNVKSKLTWTRPGQKSALTDLAKLFVKGENQQKTKTNLARTNYIKYSATFDDDFSQSVGAEHGLTIQIGKYAYVKCEAEIAFSFYEKYFSMNNYASLTGSIKF